ncbi:MAG: 5-(carboxyamino)imidazole ribonucleotide synthase [Lysobacterales bacterium]
MRVGVIGGGQLARMLALAAPPLGLQVWALDPAADACAGAVASMRQAAFDDLAALHAFADLCDVITFDFENVSAAGLQELDSVRPVRPPPRALALTQDRAQEKALFRQLGTPIAPYAVIADEDSLAAAAGSVQFPAILKTCRLGYDGKGQVRVADAQGLASAWAQLGRVPCVLEERLRFDRELSLVAVRGVDGEMRFYPLVENVHADGILAMTLAPAQVSADLRLQAQSCAQDVADALDYVGVFAIEFFEVGDQLLANEIAPRVHNSGHWSIEGAETSQFENHLRAVAGWPLGSTAARGVSCMLNWIGALPDRQLALGIPGLHWHDYGKEARDGRKVGHATLTADSIPQLAERLRLTGNVLGCELQVAAALSALERA